MTKNNKLTCEWCKEPISSNQPFMRLGGENSVIFLVHRTCYDKLLVNKPTFNITNETELIPSNDSGRLGKKAKK